MNSNHILKLENLTGQTATEFFFLHFSDILHSCFTFLKIHQIEDRTDI